MKTAVALALLSGAADAFWRMPCQSRSGLARLDPLVDPGQLSSHGHAIHGGKNFGMTVTYEDLVGSECTSCRVRQDKSAYWTPTMNFIYDNGTTEIVPQVGGMLAYYLLFGDNIKAFPAGFRMLAGDSRLRNFSGPVPDIEKSLWGEKETTQLALGQKALGFNCLNYKKAAEASMYRHFLPDKSYIDANCDDGIRAEIFFPSCWDGERMDSDNHRDHVRYPNLVNGGTCPKGFETRLPSLFFETIWNTAKYKGVGGQFVFSNGDPTGCGYHGDFITGWEVDFLQQAVDTCTNESGNIEDCGLFDIQTREDAEKCEFEMPTILSDDNCAGPADGLCGNVPVQRGPEYASALKPGNGDKPTQGYTPTTAPGAEVPTLSFGAPKSAVTDQYGGGISVANVANAPSPVADVPEIAQAPAVSYTSEFSVIEPPLITATPPPPPPQKPKGNIVSTSTYTSAGVVVEVAIEEVIEYVTVEAAPKHRRHMHHMHHMHQRRDKEHGLLGRH